MNLELGKHPRHASTWDVYVDGELSAFMHEGVEFCERSYCVSPHTCQIASYHRIDKKKG